MVAKQSALGLKIFTGFINPLNCGMVRILAVSYVNLFQLFLLLSYHLYYYFGNEIFMLKVKSISLTCDIDHMFSLSRDLLLST